MVSCKATFSECLVSKLPLFVIFARSVGPKLEHRRAQGTALSWKAGKKCAKRTLILT